MAFTDYSRASMADRNATQILPFGSHFPSPSFPSDVGSKSSDVNEATHWEVQDASLFDDTLKLDSPVDQTQLEKFCLDTEVVDDLESVEDKGLEEVSEYEEEVVLDSEDEGISRVEVGKLIGGKTYSRGGWKVVDWQKKQPTEHPEDIVADSDTSTDQQRGAGKNGSSINFENIRQEKDECQLSTSNQIPGKLNYISSPAPGETSQAIALDFVDNFLRSTNVELSQKVERRMKSRGKRPPASLAKGAHCLAKKIGLETTVKGSGTFEWVENYEDSLDEIIGRMPASSKFQDITENSVIRQHMVRHLSSKGGSTSGDRHKTQNDFVYLKQNSKCPSPRSTEQSSINERGYLVNGSMEELDKLLPSESSPKVGDGDLGGDVQDMFDVGINTQIAAEAIEALCHASPAGCKARDSQSVLKHSSKGVIKKVHFELHSPQSGAVSKLGSTSRPSIQGKHSTKKFRGVSSSLPQECSNDQQLDPTLPMTEEAKKRKQIKAEETAGKHTRNGNELVCSSKSGELVSNGKQPPRKPISQQIGQRMTENKVKGNANEKIKSMAKHGIITYRRKRKGVDADPFIRVKGKSSKLHYMPSAEARDKQLTAKEQTNWLADPLTSFLRFDTGKYPKGKRTRYRERRNLHGPAHLNILFTNFDRQEDNNCSIKIREVSEDASRLTPHNSSRKGPLDCPFRPFLETNSVKRLPRQNRDEEASEDVINCDSAAAKVQICRTGLTRTKVSTHSQKLDEVNYVSTAGNAVHNFGGLTKKHGVFSTGTEYSATADCGKKFSNLHHVYYRKACDRNLPKSSLLKELIRLGIPKSIPDVKWKDLRSRKEMAYARILLSQHLDDDIIKQQKKISAKLGISIASCAMGATHFIADRFVRTRNMLEAIALGKPVVTHLWLESCGQASCLIDEKNYILQDARKEKEIGFSMPASLARARQHPLLEGKRVCVTPNVEPNEETITSLVKASGGQAVERCVVFAAEEPISEDILIISCDKDKAMCASLLGKGAAAIYSSELLLNGIVIQKLDYPRHQLFTDNVSRRQEAAGPKRRKKSGALFM